MAGSLLPRRQRRARGADLDAETEIAAAVLHSGPAPSADDVELSVAAPIADLEPAEWFVVPNDKPRTPLSQLDVALNGWVPLVVSDILAVAFALLAPTLVFISSEGLHWPTVDPVASPFTPAMSLRFFAFVALVVIVFNWQGLYAPGMRLSALDEVPIVFRSLVITMLFGLVAEFAVDATLSEVHPAKMVLAVLSCALWIPLVRAPTYWWIGRVRRMGEQRNVAVIGMGGVATSLAGKLAASPELGLRVVAFCDTAPPTRTDALETSGTQRTTNLADVFRKYSVEHVLVAFPRSGTDALLDAIRRCEKDITVSIVPRLFDITTTHAKFEEVSRYPLLTLEQTRCRGLGAFLKRCLETIGAALALLVLSPAFAVIALAIKWDSPGSVLFRQRRVGKGGREFTLYKFRTMVPDAEAKLADLRSHSDVDSVLFKMKDDPEVTRVGRFLRRHSLDEIPQFMNVIRGNMALIGPRPPLAEEVAKYPYWFNVRLSVRPGITGLWQVQGRSNLDFDETMQLDLLYVEHWSLWLDLKILLRTIFVIITGHGAY